MPAGLDLVLALRAAEVKACTYATENGEPITDLQTQLATANATIGTLNAEIATAKADAQKTVTDLGG